MMSHQNKYVMFYGGVEFVRGYKTSLIYDLHRGTTYEVPSLVYDVFIQFKDKTVKEVKKHFNHEYDQGIDSYLDRFENLDLIFFASDNKTFEPNDYTNWDYPLKITNAILEYPTQGEFDIYDALHQLDVLGCAQLQLRVIKAGKFKMADVKKTLQQLSKSRIKVIELILPANLFNLKEEWEKLFPLNLRLSRIIFHSSDKNLALKSEIELANRNIVFLKKKMKFSQKDLVSPKTMIYNYKFFFESQEHNVALNRKVCIDKSGNYKNYLSHDQTFGNIKDLTIKKLLKNKEFKAKWYIGNDKIEKCKDCQYRYACIFNSDIEPGKDNYRKMDNCGYDPFKDKWSN